MVKLSHDLLSTLLESRAMKNDFNFGGYCKYCEHTQMLLQDRNTGFHSKFKHPLKSCFEKKLFSGTGFQNSF